MSFHDHFSSRATQYASARPTYPIELIRHLADLSPGTDCVWEGGSGSGQLTRDVAHYFTRVIATDPSFAQISNAPQLSAVTYHCAKAEASGVRSGIADLCVAAQAAHWFDLDSYYEEVRRIAKSDGVIALIAYGVTYLPESVDPIIQRFHTTVLAGYWPPERRHVDANYETLPFPFDEINTPKFEMAVEWSYHELAAYVNTWSGVQALQKAKGDEPVAAFLSELKSAWGNPQHKMRVSWPVGLKVGRVR